MKKYHLICVAMLLAIFLTCGEDNSTNPIDTSIIMPLKVGNCWEMISYDYSYFPADTTIDTFSHYISGIIEIDNENWYEMRLIYDDDTSNVTGIYANRINGLWIRRPEGLNSYGAPYLTYKYPATAGYSYNTDQYYITVESTATVIDVPYGSKACHKYVLSVDMIGAPSYIDYLAPGIGPVCSEVRNFSVTPGYQLLSRLELLDFIEGDDEYRQIGTVAQTATPGFNIITLEIFRDCKPFSSGQLLDTFHKSFEIQPASGTIRMNYRFRMFQRLG